MYPTQEFRSRGRLFLTCLFINLGAFTSGILFTAFNATFFQVLGVLNPQPKNENLLTAFLSGVVPVGGILGGVLSCLLAIKLSRRKLMILADLLLVVGCIMSQSTHSTLMIIGRGICGFVCGVNFMLIPLYVRELLPYYMNRVAAVFFRVNLTLGACLSFFVALFAEKPPTGADNIWVAVFLLPMLFGLIRLIALTFWARNDTPIFYMKNNNTDKAWETLRNIYRDIYVDEAYRRERRKSLFFRFKDIFSRTYRNQAKIAILVVLFAQLMGGNVLNFYSTKIFFGNMALRTQQDYTDVGVLNFFVACIALFANIPGNVMIRKVGKRPILTAGAAILCVLSIFIALSEAIQFIIGQQTLILLFAVVQNLTFNLVATAYAYELLPSYSLVIQVVFEMLGMLGAVFMFAIVRIELGFMIFGAMSALGFFAVFKLVKETKGMSEKDINKMFNAHGTGLLDDEVTLADTMIVVEQPDELEKREDKYSILGDNSQENTPIY